LVKSVGDFLRDKRFKKFRLIGAVSGEGRSLDGMRVVDLFKPDKTVDLHGNLVFLSNAVGETPGPALIRGLAEAGAAALLLVAGDESLLRRYGEIADEYGLPLITADSNPFNGSFIADFVSFLWDISPGASNFLSYTDISVELIDSPNIMALMSRLEDYLGIPSAYRDMALNRTLTASKDRNFTEMVKTYPLRELQRIFYYRWIVNEGMRAGCLLFSEEVKPEQLSIINAALLGLRIHLKKGNQERLARKKLSSNFFTAILEERIEDYAVFMEKLRSAGLHRDSDCLAVAVELRGEMVLDYDDFKFMMGIESIEKRISSLFENVFVMTYKDAILCIIMPAGGQQKERIMERVLHAVRLAVDEMGRMGWPECHIGCGGIKNSLASLGDSASEAMKAAQYSKINEIIGSPIFWEELDSYQIISTIAACPEAKRLHHRVLGRVLRHDREHNGELTDTLVSLERNNWNVRLTAKEMSFHPNTIKYRLHKISELLDGDVDEYRFKFDLSMALRLNAIYRFDKSILMEGD